MNNALKHDNILKSTMNSANVLLCFKQPQYLLSLILFVSCYPLYAATASVYLQDKLNALNTISADFSQTVIAKTRVIAHSSGSMALSRPKLFRWHTKLPLEQLIIADGKWLWIYDKDLEQVNVKKQGQELGDTAALFLSGYTKTIASRFTVTASINGERFDLQAKSNQANFQRITLLFHDQVLSGIDLYDQLGQLTKIHLTNIQMHHRLPLQLFQFKLPKGVDVVR